MKYPTELTVAGKMLIVPARPDSPFVVFYGEPSEAQDAELTGKLVLTNPESISVRSIRITLTGMRKVTYVAPSYHTKTMQAVH